MVASGILLVDKPGGLTSHDVVARVRRLFNTRKVGHAGTLDPMATGFLILGIEGATRLLTHIVGADKTYVATIRLGARTTTDDAEGEIQDRADARGIPDEAIRAGIAALTGPIQQVPSSVSAVKVDGRRAYDRVRAGEDVQLAARSVLVSRFELRERRVDESFIDLDVEVDCSSGTYIRALARDLGADLGVGGHLTALRRTRIGPFELARARTLEQIGAVSDPAVLLESPAAIAGALFGVEQMSAQEAQDLRHGKSLRAQANRLGGMRRAALDPEGRLIGVVEARGADIKSVMNMPEEAR